MNTTGFVFFHLEIKYWKSGRTLGGRVESSSLILNIMSQGDVSRIQQNVYTLLDQAEWEKKNSVLTASLPYFWLDVI